MSVNYSRVKSAARALRKRVTDAHVRLAITGLSQSGKTAFITSLVNQLMQGADASQLPLLDVARERRLVAARFEPQPHLDVAAFRYQQGLDALSATPPAWPPSTTGISELRLRIEYLKSGSPTATQPRSLLLDIVDYPGEWLLDLPLLNMDYRQWCEQQWPLLQSGVRKAPATDWCRSVEQLPLESQDEAVIAGLAEQYANLLQHFRQQLGLSLLQPGRMLCPGELAGAPVLAFFPVNPEALQQPDSPVLQMLEQRYDYYKQRVVASFYQRFFRRFDRQIVLVDCLTALNQGHAHFQEIQRALAMIMANFRYGEHSWLKRLFKPNIDRVLFAASKADHVTPDQYANLTQLLTELTLGGKQASAGLGVKFEAFPLAAVRATRFGHSQHQGESIPALRGIDSASGQTLTLYPGEVPSSLPSEDYFQRCGFEFVEFMPQPRDSRFKPLPHIAMDKAISFLIGDKFK